MHHTTQKLKIITMLLRNVSNKTKKKTAGKRNFYEKWEITRGVL